MIRTVYEDKNAELETYISNDGITISVKLNDMETAVEITLNEYEIFDLTDKLNEYALEVVNSKKEKQKDLDSNKK